LKNGTPSNILRFILVPKVKCFFIAFYIQKIADWYKNLRPILAANQNVYHFFHFSLIICLFLCFGNSRGFQPAKPNVFISRFTFYFY